MPAANRIDWTMVLGRAAAVVASYDTAVTLRQLFYRLVAEETLPNSVIAYDALAKRTAAARRKGTFPTLLDRTRVIHGSWGGYTGPAAAVLDMVASYRRDRTEGQPFTIILAVEKQGLVAQLETWFGASGVRILALKGYSSQSYIDTVVSAVEREQRPAVLLYGGDHDPSGVDIERDFIDRTRCWHKVERVALTPEQVVQYRIPFNPSPEVAEKLKGDTRSRRFQERFGSVVQHEVDALDPQVLRDLFARATRPYWDYGAWRAAMLREHADRTRLHALAGLLA